MPQGDKTSFTDKQKRKAAYIEASCTKNGLGMKAGETRVWAKVNELTGSGKKAAPAGNINDLLLCQP